MSLASNVVLTASPPRSTYFSATKYVWLLENVPAVQEAKEDGTLMLGTVETWLMFNFTGRFIME